MSKNNGEKNDTVKKKKGIGCGGAILIFFLVVVLLLGAGIGTGCFFLNRYLRQNFDMSLGEAWGVVNGLYDADRDKIVTNAPSAEDEKGIYSAVEQSLYLKAGTLDETSLKAIAGAVGSTETGGAAQTQINAARLAASQGDDQNALFNLFSRENADLERIKLKFTDEYDYASSYESDFVVSVTDKELLSLVKAMTQSVSADNEILGQMNFEQLILSRNDSSEPVVTLTVKLNIQNALGDFTSGMPSVLRGLIKNLAPKEIYLTAFVTMGETLSTDILINDMDAKKQESTYKLITGILKLSGQNTDSRTFINDMVNSYAGSFLDAADKYLNFDGNVSDGKLNLDLYSALAQTVFPDSGISGKDLAQLYTGVLYADTEEMLENNSQHLFEDKYLVNEDGVTKEIYSASPVADGIKINYSDEFMKELREKYLIRTEFYRDGEKIYHLPAYRDEAGTVYSSSQLNFEGGKIPSDPDGNPINTLYRLSEEPFTVTVTAPETGEYDTINLIERVTLDFGDFAALTGVGESDKITGVNLEDLFDPTLLTKKIGGEQTDDRNEWFVNRGAAEIAFDFNEKMLAALIDTQTQSFFGGETVSSGSDGESAQADEVKKLSDSMKLKFSALTVGEEEEVQIIPSGDETTGEAEAETVTVKRKYVTLGITVKTEGLFDGADFFASLLGEEIGLSVRLDVTPELEEQYLKQPEIVYSSLSDIRSEQIADTLRKAGVTALDPQTLQDQLCAPVRDAFNKMQDALGKAEIVDGGVSIPDVFGLIANRTFVQDENKTFKGEVIKISGTELHSALQGVYNTPETLSIEDKSYLAVDGSFSRVYNESHADAFDRDNSAEKTDRINFVIESSYAGLPGVSADLGTVLGYYDGGENEDIMFITYEYSLAKHLESGKTDTSLMTLEKAYATFRVNKVLADGYSNVYKATLIVNDMTGEQRTVLEKMMTYFAPENENQFDTLEYQVGKFAYFTDNTPAIKDYIQNGTLFTV